MSFFSKKATFSLLVYHLPHRQRVRKMCAMADSAVTTFEPITPAELRDLAVTMAVNAAQLVAQRRAELLAEDTTDNAAALGQQLKTTECDPVTIVDQENEKVLREFLTRVRPYDSILGEEGGGEVLTGDENAVTWVLDPIDGTVNFLYGIPAYSVSIAAAINGKVVAGAVANIVASEIFSAHRGGGASVISVEQAQADPSSARTAPRLHCNDPESLGVTLLGTGFSYTSSKRALQGALFSQVISHVRDIRRLGSAALDLCFVAAGRLDAYYEHGLHPWDRAAGGIIAQEAGAVTVIPDPAEIGHMGTLNYAVAPSVAQ